MKPILKAWIILLPALPGLALADEEDEAKYCDPPEYTIRGGGVMEPTDDALRNPDEAYESEAGKQLALRPGPYGHSELGFRYLARLFGYQGKFGSTASESQELVENWILQTDSNNFQPQRSLFRLWDKWVSVPSKRLAVPRGPVAQVSPGANPTLFFAGARDRADFSRCVRQEVNRLRCESYLGDDPLEPGDRVRFGGPGSMGACRVTKNPYGYAMVRKKKAESFISGVGKENSLQKATGGAFGAQ